MEALRGRQAPQAPALLPPAGLLTHSPLGSLVSPSPACPPPLPTHILGSTCFSPILRSGCGISGQASSAALIFWEGGMGWRELAVYFLL